MCDDMVIFKFLQQNQMQARKSSREAIKKRHRYNYENKSISIERKQGSSSCLHPQPSSRRFTSKQLKLDHRKSIYSQHLSLRFIRNNQLEANKKKFASEYAAITSNFKNLLLKNMKQQKAKIGYMGTTKNNQNGPNSKSGSSQITDPKSSYFQNRNRKLQKLFNNQSHRQIMQLDENHKSPPNPKFEAEKQKKINQHFAKIPQMLANLQNLLAIRELMDDYKNNYEAIIKKIKNYVLNMGGADVSKLETLLKIEEFQSNMRLVLCLQKAIVIGILDSLVREKFIENQINILFDSLLGVYYSILLYILFDDIGKPYIKIIKPCISILDALELHKRKDLQSTAQFIFKRIPVLFRYNQQFFAIIKALFQKAQTQKYSINKFFYFVLTQYAINLNQNPEIIHTHKHLLDTFITCPSPHLPFPRKESKKYTIIIEFQNCLSWLKGNNRYTCTMRPHAIEAILQLKKSFQVVIMTALMPHSYIETPDLFEMVDNVLYKYHCLKYKNSHLKDTKRLGRKMESVVVFDTKPQSVTNQDNLIRVSPWRGNPQDEQLIHMMRLGKNIAEDQPEDIREFIKVLKEERQQVEDESSKEAENNSHHHIMEEAEQKQNEDGSLHQQ